MDGLVILIAEHLQKNPTSGQLFLFRNRHSNKIKLLWWERNGFWLLYKRLERGRLHFPVPSEHVMELTRDQLSWLLSGIEWMKHVSQPAVTATHFY